MARQGARPARRRRSDLWFIHHLVKRVRALYARLRRRRATGRSSTSRWDYPEVGDARRPATPRPSCREINGYDVATGEPVSGLRRPQGRRLDRVRLLDLLRRLRRRRQPGAAARARRPRRADGGWVSPEWACAWPANRRMLYNRASADPRGQAVVGAQALRLVGRGAGQVERATTCPTSRPTSAPDYRAAAGRARAWTRSPATDPFIMKADGHGWLFAPAGLLDGPLPTHYEPLESPVAEPALPQAPGATRRRCAGTAPDNPTDRASGDPRYPLVATTYRLTEHHTAGGMIRRLPWLAELQPEMFAEIDPELAARARDRGRRLDGDRLPARRRSRRARRVTERMRPLKVDGRAGAPGRAAVALGLRRARSPATRPTTSSRCRRPERLDPGGQGVRLQRAGRAPRAPVHRASRRGATTPRPASSVDRDHPAEERPHK